MRARICLLRSRTLARSLPNTERAKDAAKAAARAEAARAERTARESEAAAAAAREDEERRARLRAAAAATSAPPPGKCMLTELSDEEAAAAAQAAPTSAPPADVDAEEEEAAKGKQRPNAGNGGEAEWGSWTQTLTDAEMRVAVPYGTTAKAVAVEIKKQHIKVGLKGQPPIVDGTRSGRLWT